MESLRNDLRSGFFRGGTFPTSNHNSVECQGTSKRLRHPKKEQMLVARASCPCSGQTLARHQCQPARPRNGTEAVPYCVGSNDFSAAGVERLRGAGRQDGGGCHAWGNLHFQMELPVFDSPAARDAARRGLQCALGLAKRTGVGPDEDLLPAHAALAAAGCRPRSRSTIPSRGRACSGRAIDSRPSSHPTSPAARSSLS